MRRLNKHHYLKILEYLQRDAEIIARKFKLREFTLHVERPNVRNRYGVCYDDGTIRIRFHDLRSGKTLRYSSLIDTLCHELAHLRYFNHGERFQRLYKRMLEFARTQGIYRPHIPPKQLTLEFF